MDSKMKKSDRFKKIATNRTNRVLNDLRLLGNCSNRANYEYSANDVKKIFNAIESELRKAKARYKEKDSERFEL